MVELLILYLYKISWNSIVNRYTNKTQFFFRKFKVYVLKVLTVKFVDNN